MDDLKQIIAVNIAFYRKEKGLTQVELAEKLNYSDKAVSKWERGEAYPDIATLVALAKLFGITVNELVTDKKKVKKAKPLIALLSAGLVWLIATAVFVIMNMAATIPHTWLVFVYAIPVCAVVLLVLFAIWRKNLLILVAETVLMWTVATCIYLTILFTASIENSFFIFFLPIPLQILAILWYEFRVKRRLHFRFKRGRVKKTDRNDKNDSGNNDKNSDHVNKNDNHGDAK